MKAMSLVFTLSMVDIFAQAKLLASLHGDYLLTFAIAAGVYWGICVAFQALFRGAERVLSAPRSSPSRSDASLGSRSASSNLPTSHPRSRT
ncbi:MAG: hypothetical protein LBR58_05950 [Propionibacteriaceae bacterium]|jgi:ABC-type arginine/histidine transport system permease subunit|nr:hypothetical protein [Propionibacteriaceae bacterium]